MNYILYLQKIGYKNIKNVKNQQSKINSRF